MLLTHSSNLCYNQNKEIMGRFAGNYMKPFFLHYYVTKHIYD